MKSKAISDRFLKEYYESEISHNITKDIYKWLQSQPENKVGHLEDGMIFCAFRYSLGRSTYVVSNVVEYIHARWEHLRYETLERMNCEIIEYVTNFGSNMYDCDKDEWITIVNRFKDEIKF